MSKPFITYTTQIEKLKSEKNLIIVDSDFAVEALQNISYYALIGGYKHPFIDIHTRKYINEARFEDIVSLYEFDEVVCAPSSRQLKKYRFFATQIMLGSIFMLP